MGQPDDQWGPTTDQPPIPANRRRTGLIVTLVVAAIVTVLAVVGSAAWFLFDGTVTELRGAAPFTVQGTLTIQGGDCTSWGYNDLHDGTEVTLTDENGKLLAVGALTRSSMCSFTFSLDNVPPGRQFYGITVTHRGTLHYNEQQLRQGVELTIG